MSKDQERFIIDDNKIALEELRKEFNGISYISDEELVSTLNKNTLFRKFDFQIVDENKSLFDILKSNKTINFDAKNYMFMIISLIEKFLSEHKDYPRVDILLKEKETLEKYINESNKNIFIKQGNNDDFTYYDELVLNLSELERVNSLPLYFYLINDTKEELYNMLANVLKDEDSEDALDIEYDLSNDSKINKYTITAFRLCFKNSKYPRIPNVITIAPDVMIEAFKDYDGTENIRAVILKHVKEYILSFKEKSLNDTLNDKIVKEYIFACEDSVYNPELQSEYFKKYDEIKDNLTKEQQLMVSRNNYEYKNYGMNIQQKVITLKAEAKKTIK